MAIIRLNLEAIFNQMWVQDERVQLEVILIKKQKYTMFLVIGF